MNILEALNDPRTFEEADSLYSETLRSKNTYSVFNQGSYSITDIEEILLGLLTEHIYDESNCDDPFPDIISYGMDPEEAMKEIHAGLEFVEICNYKGEDLGYSLNLNHRIFLSKYNYEVI